MSSASAASDKTNVSVQVSDDFLDKFDRVLKQAQLDGDAPMGMSRAEAIRTLMKAGIEDPGILSEYSEDE
jgi:metal-responsive CopG/Arc/MetJ family transcriptional regulator